MKTMKNKVFFSIVIWILWTNVEARTRNTTPKPPNCPHTNNTVNCAPKFRKNITSDTIFSGLKENDEQTFICPQAYGNPTPNVTWYKNGINLNISVFKWTTYGLKVDQDQGNYTCIVCNGGGCIQHTYRVSIKREALKIYHGPTNDSLTIGQTEEDVVGAPSILWFISGGIVLAVLLAIVMLFFYHKFRENNPIPPTAMKQYLRRVVVTKNLDSDSNYDELKNRIDVRFDNYVAPENFIKEGNQCYEFQKDEDWDIPSEHVRILDGKPLGEGNFGIVYKAEAYGILEPGTFTTVAVKTLKDGYNEEAVKNFVLETEIMKVIGRHKNIINLLGVCVDTGEMMVIMEYAARGSLLSLLRTQNHEVANEEYYAILGNNLSELTLLGFALQIAEAMEFLASKKCIHRDLAARNVLVTENYVMKVADFGLARNVHENDYYRLLSEFKLPIKWMAPESLYQQKYTTQSDVWSFGITLYEIMSQGTPPYPVLSATEVMKQVREGLRMDKPELCSIQTYQLMQDCWSYLPEERPTFTEIKERLAELISNMEQVPENFEMDSSSSESEEELESSLYNAPLIQSSLSMVNDCYEDISIHIPSLER